MMGKKEYKDIEMRKVGESKVSQRGSVVVPKAIRFALSINQGDQVEWFIGDGIILIQKKGEAQKQP